VLRRVLLRSNKDAITPVAPGEVRRFGFYIDYEIEPNDVDDSLKNFLLEREKRWSKTGSHKKIQVLRFDDSGICSLKSAN